MLRVRIICATLILSFAVRINICTAQNPDFTILHSLNAGSRPGWDDAMRSLSETAGPVSVGVPIGITMQAAFSKKGKDRLNALNSGITIALAMSVSTVIKFSVQRTRPYDRYAGVIIQRDDPSTFSFPSGHTTSAFATAASLSLTYRKWYVAAPAYAYAGFVAYTRMRLGVHYPSDVLAGMIIGTGSGFLVWHIQKKISANRKKVQPES